MEKMISKKAARPKRMSEELSRAQYRLDSACVRGEDKEIIDKLSADRDAVLEREKK
ncbi:hypothetical protein G6L37_07385 [Agrobacterium rubi]|nr:hypothetical protein [Agrobacterium rubi]NTF25190.1 hypothetical protein [Agrobacterium rubi]